MMRKFYDTFPVEPKGGGVENNHKLLVQFTDSWEGWLEGNPPIPESDRWMCWIPSMAGMLEVGPTQEEAFRNLMTGLAVKIAYDSNYSLPKIVDEKKLSFSEAIKQLRGLTCGYWDNLSADEINKELGRG